mgnify:CR=1 FL=1
MIQRTNADMLFTDFYEQWITTYKQGAIRPVTMSKYKMAHQWLVRLIPDLKIGDITRITYQQLLNNYAAEHERQTTMDFHHHIKCAILDAVDEGLIERDPTRKAIIKGRPPKDKKQKYPEASRQSGSGDRRQLGLVYIAGGKNRYAFLRGPGSDSKGF